MLNFLLRALAGVALLALMPLASAQSLQVKAAPPGVREVDLYDAKQSDRYVKSIDVKSLTFPIPIIEERALGFVIRLRDGAYYVGASDVETNKVYDSSSQCPSKLDDPTGASRGVRGRGCK